MTDVSISPPGNDVSDDDRRNRSTATSDVSRRSVLAGAGQLGLAALLTAGATSGTVEADHDFGFQPWTSTHYVRYTYNNPNDPYADDELVGGGRFVKDAGLQYLGTSWDPAGDPSPDGDADGAWRHTFRMYSHAGVFGGLCRGDDCDPTAGEYDTWKPAMHRYFEDTDFELPNSAGYALGIDTNRLIAETLNKYDHLSISARRHPAQYGFLPATTFAQRLGARELDDDVQETMETVVNAFVAEERTSTLARLRRQAKEERQDDKALWTITEVLILAGAGLALSMPAGFVFTAAWEATKLLMELLDDSGDNKSVEFQRGFQQKYDAGDDGGSIPFGGHFVTFDVTVSPNEGDATFAIRSDIVPQQWDMMCNDEQWGNPDADVDNARSHWEVKLPNLPHIDDVDDPSNLSGRTPTVLPPENSETTVDSDPVASFEIEQENDLPSSRSVRPGEPIVFDPSSTHIGGHEIERCTWKVWSPSKETVRSGGEVVVDEDEQREVIDPANSDGLSTLEQSLPADTEGWVEVQLKVKDVDDNVDTTTDRVLVAPESEFSAPQLIVENWTDSDEESGEQEGSEVEAGETLKFDATAFGEDAGAVLEWGVAEGSSNVEPLEEVDDVVVADEEKEGVLRELRFQRGGEYWVEVSIDQPDRIERPGNLPTSDGVTVHVESDAVLPSEVSIDAPGFAWSNTVTFTKNTTGGTTASLSYEWSGDVSGSGRELEWSFDEGGQKEVTLTVSNGGASISAETTTFILSFGGLSTDSSTPPRVDGAREVVDDV